MKLKIEHITTNHRFWREIAALAIEAFPTEEYLPLEKLVNMAEEDEFDFWR